MDFLTEGKKIKQMCNERIDGCLNPEKCPYYDEDAIDRDHRGEPFRGCCMFTAIGMGEPWKWKFNYCKIKED